ncbi:MAG: hypothetical protein SGI88_21055 [Candidatus Hydrogenedentes bacterium]|nr:hypothetical protein [Candidatus Hydrogenedentota bacterium]
MHVARAAIAILAAFISIAGTAQQTEFDALDALSGVALSGDNEAAAILHGRLADPAVPVETWRKDFQEYFRDGVFTTPLGLFWDFAVRDFTGEDRAHAAIVSAICACEAVKAALPRVHELPAAYESLTLSFRWLEHVYPAIAPNGRVTIFDALDQSLSGVGLATIAQQRSRYAFYIQAGLTLRAYAIGDAGARQRLAAVLGLQGGPQIIWQTHGILLFDNNAYSVHHIASLSSVLNAIPRDLHAIQAIIVPEATGINAGAGFVSAGQVLYLPYIAMDLYTSRHEFIEGPGPVAPIFTVTVAQEIVRAVQAVQFVNRPELAFRRDVILANAGQNATRYLRHYRMVSPSVYWSNPDELLPALAYVYFIDSRAAFQMAIMLFALKEEEPIDQFLLLADLLSGGSNTSSLYATTPDGAVTRATSAIGRVHGSWVAPPNAAGLLHYRDIIPANVWFCNAIAYGGDNYVFDFDAHGITVRYLRR